MDAAIAALIGAAVGAVGSFGAMWIQQRHQTRRERLKLAADLGLADYKEQVENASKYTAPTKVPPLSAYVMYHADFLDELAKGEITPATIQRLHKRQQLLMEHYYDHKKNRDA